MNVALVIGHHALKKGAYSPYLGMSEFDFYNEVVKCINADVYRHDAHIRGYSNRIRATASKLNQKDYDLVISLHFNASEDPRANGCETLYYFNSKKSRDYARAFSNLVHKRTGIKVRNGGLKALSQKRDRGFSMVYYPKSPTILIEPFFGSNSTDCRKIRDVERVANIINEFIESYE